MLLVPTVIRPSPIAGVGLFATMRIPAGERIWAFDPAVDWRLSGDDLAAFPEPWLSLLRQWCYEETDGVYVLCGDNAKFMNHSFEPNCLDEPPEATITLRDIQPGEELTCDYRVVDRQSARDGLEAWRHAVNDDGNTRRLASRRQGVSEQWRR